MIHRDQWAFDFYPFPSGYEVQCNTIWAMTDFTEENGATRVLASAVHGVLSGPAMKRIDDAPIDRLIVTNTIPLTEDKARTASEKIVVLSVARLLAQAIRSIHEETSVSKLFV